MLYFVLTVIYNMVILILIWNIFVFLLFAYDKFSSIRQGKRISEKALILSSLLLGGVGALLSMEIFRHKTKHLKFKIIIPLSFLITIFITILLLDVNLL